MFPLHMLLPVLLVSYITESATITKQLREWVRAETKFQPLLKVIEPPALFQNCSAFDNGTLTVAHYHSKVT
jgi:hypothetical protein